MDILSLSISVCNNNLPVLISFSPHTTICPNFKPFNLGEYITEARYSYNKVWADDSGRNLSGSMSGTLIGIFPKIIVSFRRLTKSELEIITPILDSARQTLQYYDPTKRSTQTITTYTGDYEVINKKIVDEIRKNDNFEISFIAISKRA